MNRVTLVELRRNADGILRRVEKGKRFVLTRRGRPVARLEPVREPASLDGAPIYRLAEIATDEANALSNPDMDRAIYGL